MQDKVALSARRALPFFFLTLLISASWLLTGEDRHLSQPTLLPATTDQTESGDSTTSQYMKINEAYGKLPLSFEHNQGQTDGQVVFLSRGPGYNLFLTATEAVLVLRGAGASNSASDTEVRADTQVTAVRMRLVGASRAPRVQGLDPLPGRTNYLLGNDPKK